MLPKYQINFLAIYVVLLTGCANTHQDFRSSPPFMEATSTKEANVVAVCITDGWENVVNGFNLRPTFGGFTITFVSNGLIYYMADVMKSVNGSTTKYWIGTFTIDSYVNKLGDIVKRCQS